MCDLEKSLAEAEERLKRNRENIKKRRKQSKSIEEPEHLRSGVLDELELERRKRNDSE